MNRKAATEQKDQYKPTGANPKYRVDNWQIPVPIGDASAHFLVQVSEGNKPKVINAFFMDGGEDGQNGDTAWGQIAKALSVIADAYDRGWVFDAVATTHHDSDHFKGLKDLMTKKINNAPTSKTYRKVYFAKELTHYAGNPKVENTGALWSPTPCAAVIAGEGAIGVDMFSRTRLFCIDDAEDLEEYDDERGIKEWTKKGDQLKRPRFVIVGANGYGMHIDPAQSQMITTPSENQMSLLALVYWPGTGRTSYFTGGDGNPKVELGGVVPWMERNKETNKRHYPVLPVDMVKLDHHGSLNESLNDKSLGKLHYTILDKMEPRDVLVTPGHKYGHPNWVILQLVRNHFIKMKKIFKDKNPQGQLYKLFTTRSPYWMTKKNAGMMDANINHATYDKVIGVLEAMGDRDDENGISIDSLFLAEAARWEEYTDEKKKFVEELAVLVEWLDYFDKDGKPKMGDINHKLDKDFAKMKTKLRASYEVLKSRRKTSEEREEPLREDSHDHQQTLQESRDNIVWHARQTWSEICDQEICDEGSVYFLVRFWFEEGCYPTINGSMDEAGNKKPLQSTFTKMEEEAMKISEVVDSDGIESIIVKSKKAKPDEYTHVNAMGSAKERRAYMDCQKTMNFELARFFHDILIVGEFENNPLKTGIVTNTSTSGNSITQKGRKTSPVLRDMTADFMDSDDATSVNIKRNSKQQKMSRVKTEYERTADHQTEYGKTWRKLKMKRLKEQGLLPKKLVPFDEKGDSEEGSFEPDSSDDEAESVDSGKAVGKKMKTGNTTGDNAVKTRKQSRAVVRSKSDPKPKSKPKDTKKTTTTRKKK